MTIFKDRRDAGEKLASKLARLSKQDGVVFGLARGGVITALPIAKGLLWPLRPLVIRKIGHPYFSEYAIGAVTATGDCILNEKETMGMDEALLKGLVRREENEAKRRENLYSKDLPALSLKNKMAVVVDDGVATGLTLKLAIKSVREMKPAQILVACPVAPAETAEEIYKLVDQATFLEADQNFLGAVGAHYLSFPQTSDEEVIQALTKANQKINDFPK